MSVKQIMSARVVTVDFDDTLAAVKEIFDKLKFHHVLVVENGQLFGVVSDRDLLKAISPNLGTPVESPKDTATLNKRVHHIMTRKPIVLPPEARVSEAIQIFNEHRISCIPIVDTAGRPIGIITWRDIFRVIAANKPLIDLDSGLIVGHSAPAGLSPVAHASHA